MFKIGQKLTSQNYTQGALWCHKNNAHIEAQGGDFIIVQNTPPEEDLREQLTRAEIKTGLTRAVREMVLADNSGAGEYVRVQARRLEDLARGLRHG